VSAEDDVSTPAGDMGAAGGVVTVVGGCGHVGLPLAIALADAGHQVRIYDIDATAVGTVNRGELPFVEAGAGEVLKRCLATGRLEATTAPSAVAGADTVVVVIGTPVDEHLNPDPGSIRTALQRCIEHLEDGQLVVLRSTVFPGVTAMVDGFLAEHGLDVDVAFCPERIAEGRAMVELYTLPQIVSGTSPRAVQRASALFSTLAPSVVELTPEEAELAKLFTNTWRYVKFAVANQLYMFANDHGLDFERIRTALREDYPRAADLPSAGFAAGPCLLKDTMQLAAFSNNSFLLGHSAMLVNEGLPLYVVSRLADRFDLASMTVGILGMAFKAESDDTRDSLSYKLKRLLRFKAKDVVTTDPLVRTDPDLRPLSEVLERADLLIVGVPHPEYAELRPTQPVADIWNVLGHGCRV
jgi:UDP-N-acetyl-D-mannosaminuronic acid dehydrogenase